jgi:hypothetical protein
MAAQSTDSLFASQSRRILAALILLFILAAALWAFVTVQVLKTL